MNFIAGLALGFSLVSGQPTFPRVVNVALPPRAAYYRKGRMW